MVLKQSINQIIRFKFKMFEYINNVIFIIKKSSHKKSIFK